MKSSPASKRHQLQWTIGQEGDATLVTFSGVVDERADFSTLPPLAGEVVFDLADVQRLNSHGVGLWATFVAKLSEVTRLVYRRCSPSVVTALNLVHAFRGSAEVESFFAPYVCEATGTLDLRLLTRADLPDPRCPPTFSTEAGLFELDDLPERYFAFLLGH